MEEKFIRLKVVEDNIYNQEEFLAEFKQRCEDKDFPIVIKIDEAPDLRRLTLDNKNLVNFVTEHPHSGNLIVETDNMVQQVPGVKINKWFNELPFFHFKNASIQPKQIEKKFMLFVGNHRWPRFILAEFIHRHHLRDSYLTYWQKFFPLDDLKAHMPIKTIEHFKAQLPIYVDSKELIERHHFGYVNYTDTNALEEFYHRAFLDIVCETWHLGDTFLPTEKIARPLALKNPFIVYGPKHFMKNLRRLGFKTFGNYWSEDYDECEGAERINMMKSQIDLLSGKSKDELQKLLDDMESVLDHNRDVYQNIKLDSINTEFSCRLTKYTF